MTAANISLSDLALIFCPSAFYGEFTPNRSWHSNEIYEVCRTLRRPGLSHDLKHLKTLFDQSVAELLDNVEIAAVSFSGGLDSTAVAMAVAKLQRTRGRKTIIVVADIVDDAGIHAADLARTFAREFLSDCPLLVAKGGRAPVWRGDGPRLDAMPYMNAEMTFLAEAEGAEIFITGSGADECMGTPRFLLSSMWRSPRTLLSYLRLAMQNGAYGLATELLAVVSRSWSDGDRAAFFLATAEPYLSWPAPFRHLTERLRKSCSEWQSDYTLKMVCDITESDLSLAALDAHFACSPMTIHPSAGKCRQASPYLTDSFLEGLRGFSLAARFSSSFRAPYHQRKAMVMHLIPTEAWEYLPRSKSLYSVAISDAHRLPSAHLRILVELGFVDERRFEAIHESQELPLLSNVAVWLAEAIDRGYTIID